MSEDGQEWAIIIVGLAVLPLIAFALGYAVAGAVIFIVTFFWLIHRGT